MWTLPLDELSSGVNGDAAALFDWKSGVAAVRGTTRAKPGSPPRFLPSQVGRSNALSLRAAPLIRRSASEHAQPLRAHAAQHLPATGGFWAAPILGSTRVRGPGQVSPKLPSARRIATTLPPRASTAPAALVALPLRGATKPVSVGSLFYHGGGEPRSPPRRNRSMGGLETMATDDPRPEQPGGRGAATGARSPGELDLAAAAAAAREAALAARITADAEAASSRKRDNNDASDAAAWELDDDGAPCAWGGFEPSELERAAWRRFCFADDAPAWRRFCEAREHARDALEEQLMLRARRARDGRGAAGPPDRP